MSRSDNVTEAPSESPSCSSRSLDRGALRRSPKEQPPKTTPKARLRHDDSQIQFAAIESSPLASEIPDSQLLTDRQREVRERQNLEAGVMFPDLRSTPKRRIRERGEVSPKLILKGTQVSRTELDLDDNCPMLPVVDEILDDVFGSSPTPRSGRRSSDQRSFSSGPHSSPLGKAQLEAKPYDEPPLPYNRLAQCGVKVEDKILNNGGTTSEIHIKASGEPMKISNISDETLQLPLDKSRERFIEPETRDFIANNLDQEMTDINPTSDFEIFVDAPSDPLQTTESDVQEQRVEVSRAPPQSQEISKPSDNPISHEIIREPVTSYAPGNVLESDESNVITSNEEEVSGIIGSFPGSERSYVPGDDEQIAAQIVRDLEQASSQAESEVKRKASTIRQSGKACEKRKLSTGKLGPTKKVKIAPSKPHVVQAIVVSKKPVDADVDGMFIPGVEYSYLSDEESKEEHSTSPFEITRASTRISNRSSYRTGRSRSPTGSDYSNQISQAPSQESHILPIKTNPQLSSSSGIPALVDLSLQRRSALFRQSSIESMDARNSPSAKHDEVDEAPQSVEISRYSGSGAEMRHPSSGIREIERELAVDCLELQEPCRELARDKAITGDQVAISPRQSIGIHNLATQSCQEQTEIEKAASTSRTIDLPSGADHILSARLGLDTAPAVGQDWLDATQQVGNAMQPGQELRAQGIVAEFKRLLGGIRQVQLNAEEEREMIGTLFECVREVHEAGRRSTDG